jgi:RimJ/RimL family protein N-acetyltransferase
VTIGERIDGRRISLAPLSVEHAETWARWMNDPETSRYLFPADDPPRGGFTAAEELQWGRRGLADPRRLVVALEERESGRLIGHARLTPLRRGRASFGIVIGEAEQRGRGLGREATALICLLAFEELGLNEVVLDVDPRNEPAIRAYEAVGFERTRADRMRLRAPLPAHARALVAA